MAEIAHPTTVARLIGRSAFSGIVCFNFLRAENTHGTFKQSGAHALSPAFSRRDDPRYWRVRDGRYGAARAIAHWQRSRQTYSAVDVGVERANRSARRRWRFVSKASRSFPYSLMTGAGLVGSNSRFASSRIRSFIAFSFLKGKWPRLRGHFLLPVMVMVPVVVVMPVGERRRRNSDRDQCRQRE